MTPNTDDWIQVATDAVALWEHPDGMALVVTEHDDELHVTLERTIRANGHVGTIETMITRAGSVDEATERLEDIMDQLDRDTVTAIHASEDELEGDPIVEFFCVFESTLPAGIDPEDLTVDPDDGTVETVSAMDVADDPDEIDHDQSVQVDIYPLPAAMVDEVDDE